MEIQLDFEPNGVVAMFDQHDVIDTMNFEEACHTGVSLDLNDSVTTLLCSHGKDHRREAFEPRAEWLPMVKECEGCIFTDYREGFHRTVDIYRESWMSPDCIAVRGDKGQVAKLLRRPTILFDDKEDNVSALRRRSTNECFLDGVVVRRGRKRYKEVRPGFAVENECAKWADIVHLFSANPHAIPIVSGRHRALTLAEIARLGRSPASGSGRGGGSGNGTNPTTGTTRVKSRDCYYYNFGVRITSGARTATEHQRNCYRAGCNVSVQLVLRTYM